MVRWTGRGSIESLKSTVEEIIRSMKAKSKVRVIGDCLAVSGSDPAYFASALDRTPGVAWISVGAGGKIGTESALLAKKYLRRGHRFEVIAESSSGAATSDLAGEATSAILGAVPGSRSDSRKPKRLFRVAKDGEASVVGVQLREGPGGTTLGTGVAVCFVSGGKHSSVVAWQALLSGFRAALVHYAINDEALREVARLYVELVSRVGPRGIRLEVIRGSSTEGALARRATGGSERFFMGCHAGGEPCPKTLIGRVESPLFALTEEQFDEIHVSLSLKGEDSKPSWGGLFSSGRPRPMEFSGWAGSAAEVLSRLS